MSGLIGAVSRERVLLRPSCAIGYRLDGQKTRNITVPELLLLLTLMSSRKLCETQ